MTRSVTAGLVAEVREFRAGFHSCFTGWADAGFELADAVACAPGPVSSIPELSLEPVFRRSHGSLYKALSRGGIDPDAMRDLLVKHRPADWPLVFAVDASTWARCDAECSPERGFYYSASKHSAGQPIVAGWSYQWITQLCWDHDSWTAPLDAVRLRPDEDTTDATANQVRELVGRVGETPTTPVFVFDAGFDAPALTDELADIRVNLIVRIRDDRVFHTDPPEHQPGQPGRPRRHGRTFKCSDPASWPEPDEQHTTTDPRYGTVTISAWHRLHPRLVRRGHWTSHEQPPIVPATIVRVDAQHLPKPTSRTNKPLWLWVAGPDPDLHTAWQAYLRRFDIEHTYRFVKNTLGWTTPRWCTPEQADTWTWIIIAVHTQLRLTRDLITDERHPWERQRKPARLTPARTRRGFRRLAPTLGTPARPPKPSTPGPGRPKGTHRPPRTRHPAIKKAHRKV